MKDNEFKHWGVAGGCALVAVALVLILVRAPVAPAVPPRPAALPPMLLRATDGSDVAFDEKKMLADPTPLFLPTKWNAAPKGVPRPEPGARFENFPGRLRAAASETGLSLNLPPSVNVPTTPIETLLADRPGSLLAGFGRAATALPVLESRGAFVEIIAEGTGRAVLRQALLDVKLPNEGVWEPMEFLAAIDATGLVGAVSVTRRSGVEGVDNYFQRYLAQTLRVGQRLAPGFYRICVGP